MDFEKLTELIIELEVDDIADAVKEALGEDKDPFDVLTKITIDRMKENEITEEDFKTLGIQPRNDKRIFEPNKKKSALSFLKCFGF